ncbi:MAG: uncharacterized membrane protein YjfL (UPF0719 family) [Paracoccaceae bacterium]|jgi:uncharacterized membrane protein YjfL (UPF0719 family)
MNIEQYAIYALYTLIYVGCAFILKLALSKISAVNYTADTEVKSGNMAVGFRRSGAQFGLAIAMMGVLAGQSESSLGQDILKSVEYGLLAVVFIVSALMTADKWVLPGIHNLSELQKANTSVGLVEMGMLVATGIMAYASIVGDAGGFVSSIAYFVVGQLTLVVLVLVYEKVMMRSHDIVVSIGKGNVSSGIYLGGKLIAYSLILKSAITGNGVNTLNEMILEYLVLAATGMILLYIFEILIDRVVVTASTVKEALELDQPVVILQIAAAKVGVALILSNAVL